MAGNRVGYSLFGVVFVCAILAAPAQASWQKKTNMGNLALMDGWQVGRITAPDAEYCAMVGRYDRYASLVVARNVDGYGSLALDFGEALFQAGGDYDMALRPDAGKTRSVKASAASDRSVVVQIGRGDGLLRELARSNSLLAALPDFDVTFDLQNADAAVEDLGACAARLSGGNLAVKFDDDKPEPPAFEFSDTAEPAPAGARDDKICWGKDKYLKASLVSSQARVVALSAQARKQDKEHADVEKAEAAEYMQRIAALEAERDALKSALAQKTPAPEFTPVPAQDRMQVSAQDIVWKQGDVRESETVASLLPPVRGAGGYYAQLGSFKDVAGVHSHWKRVVKKYPQLLENIDYSSEEIDLGAKGTWFRLRTARLPKEAATEICNRINADTKQGCIVRQ